MPRAARRDQLAGGDDLCREQRRRSVAEEVAPVSTQRSRDPWVASAGSGRGDANRPKCEICADQLPRTCADAGRHCILSPTVAVIAVS